MKRQYLDASSIRKWYGEDWIAMQNEIYKALEDGVLGTFPDGIITGIDVSGTAGNYSISPGYCWLSGKIRFFPGADGLTEPINTYYLKPTYETESTRPYVNGESYPIVKKYGVVLEVGYTAGIQMGPSISKIFDLVHKYQKTTFVDISDVTGTYHATIGYSMVGQHVDLMLPRTLRTFVSGGIGVIEYLLPDVLVPSHDIISSVAVNKDVEISSGDFVRIHSLPLYIRDDGKLYLPSLNNVVPAADFPFEYSVWKSPLPEYFHVSYNRMR